MSLLSSPGFALFLIAFAALLDIAANLLLAASDGFRRIWHGFGALILVGSAFYLLSLAVESMDLAVAYALWGALGILGTCLGGLVFFGQKIRLPAWLGIILLIVGIILLKF